MFLTDYLLGILEDNTGYFIGQDSIYKVGLNYGEQIKHAISSQPILQDTLAYLVTLANPILIFNLYVIATLILNLLTAFVLFNKKQPRYIAILQAITYSIAPFILFKSQNHPALMATWLLNLGIFFILNNKLTLKRAILLSVYLAFATLASNYYGYFLMLTVGIYYSLSIINFFYNRKVKATFKHIGKLLLMYGLSVILIAIVIWPYISANFLQNDTIPLVSTKQVIIDDQTITVTGTDWQIAQNINTQNTNQMVIKRSLEDFVHFTSRPWYYLLPPTNNIFFGQISKSIIDHLQSIPGNWLAQNYFMREHSASYLGWANILLFIIGILYAYKAKKHLLNPILITIAILFLITMPPFFTIAGNKIYLPSYILYLLFPMFRTLSRLGMVILPLFMIIAGYGYQYLFGLNKKYIGVTIALLLFIFSIAEFIIPLKITPADYKAELFIKLNVDLPKEAVLALYPEEDANIVVFNINRLQRPLINPKGYVAPEFGFDAQNFTDNLPTCQGILEARNLGVTHILVYGRPDKPYTEIRNQLRTSELINSNVNYSDYDAEIFEIKQTIDYQKAKTDCLTKIQNN